MPTLSLSLSLSDASYKGILGARSLIFHAALFHVSHQAPTPWCTSSSTTSGSASCCTPPSHPNRNRFPTNGCWRAPQRYYQDATSEVVLADTFSALAQANGISFALQARFALLHSTARVLSSLKAVYS